MPRSVAAGESGADCQAGAIMRAVLVMPRVSGVILAGGKSRRMGGSPKALLPFGGRPLIEHIAETLRSVLPDCLLVTNTPELYGSLGLPMVGDVFPEGGSLGGIYSGLQAASGDAALCVACDMPFLSAPLVAHLAGRATEADVVIPEAGGELQKRSTPSTASRVSRRWSDASGRAS